MDAALDPRIAENKSISGTVAGNANVLIFPDLQSANITAKQLITLPDPDSTDLSLPVFQSQLPK